MRDNIYIKSSPNSSDKHEKQGLEPRFFSFNELAELGHPQNLLGAIRANCISCCGGSLSEVRKCNIKKCSLWPMRMGFCPFHAKSKHSQNKEIAPEACMQSEAFEISSEKESSANVYPRS